MRPRWKALYKHVEREQNFKEFTHEPSILAHEASKKMRALPYAIAIQHVTAWMPIATAEIHEHDNQQMVVLQMQAQAGDVGSSNNTSTGAVHASFDESDSD